MNDTKLLISRLLDLCPNMYIMQMKVKHLLVWNNIICNFTRDLGYLCLSVYLAKMQLTLIAVRVIRCASRLQSHRFTRICYESETKHPYDMHLFIHTFGSGCFWDPVNIVSASAQTWLGWSLSALAKAWDFMLEPLTSNTWSAWQSHRSIPRHKNKHYTTASVSLGAQGAED